MDSFDYLEGIKFQQQKKLPKIYFYFFLSFYQKHKFKSERVLRSAVRSEVLIKEIKVFLLS